MLGQTAPALIEFFDDRGDGERILGALFIAAVHDETHVRNTLHGAQTLKFVGFTVHTVVFNTTTMRPVAGSVWCTSAVFEDLSRGKYGVHGRPGRM